MRIPVNIQRLDFGAQEMVGTGRAQFSQAGCICTVDEAHDCRISLYSADKQLGLGDSPSQPGKQSAQSVFVLGIRQRLVLHASKRAVALIVRLNVFGGLFDQVKRKFVAFLVALVPVDETMLTHHDTLPLGVSFAKAFQFQA